MDGQQQPTLAVWQPQARCAVCKSVHCGEISDLLVMRSRRQSLSDGTRVTMAWIIQVAPDRWGQRFSEKSLARHFARHLSPVTTTAAVSLQTEEATAGDLARVFEALDPAKATGRELAEGIVRAAAIRLKRRPQDVSLQMGLQAAQLLERSAEAEQNGNLMRLLGGAVAAAVAPKPPAEPVVEAEVVAEVEAPSGE